MAKRPERLCSMHQFWHDLLFLHWEVPVDRLQSLIPPELTIDTYEGKAYIGLVAFRISQIRKRGFPAVPGLRQFPEINVRTYVHKAGKDPGVWFFSLDASNLFACIGARMAYKLPYYFSEITQMDTANASKVTTQFRSKRYLPRPLPAYATIDYTVQNDPVTMAEKDSLEHFFVERYLLYSQVGDGICVGQVYHAPYPIERVVVTRLEENLVQAAGIMHPDSAPIIHFSRGVDVLIYSLEHQQSAVVN